MERSDVSRIEAERQRIAAAVFALWNAHHNRTDTASYEALQDELEILQSKIRDGCFDHPDPCESLRSGEPVPEGWRRMQPNSRWIQRIR